MSTSPVATATILSATWRFTRIVDGGRTYFRGARTNAAGELVKTPKVFQRLAQLQNYLHWLQQHGWRVQFSGVQPARPVRVVR